MVKKVFIPIVLFLSMVVAGCQAGIDGTEEQRGELHGELEILPFSKAVKETDLIAEVEIIEAVKEIDDPSPKTIFEVSIQKVHHGDSSLEKEERHVLQQGNSDWTFNENELFQTGDRYILFLKSTIGIDYADFWILGEEGGMYQVIDEEVVVKLAYDDEELQSAEASEPIKKEIFNLVEFDSQDVQILDKPKFIEMIQKNN